MARAYSPPGVRVTEETTSVLNTVIGTPNRLAIVGPAKGKETITERIQLAVNGATGDSVTLAKTGVDTNTVVVKRAIDGATVNPGNYRITQLTDPDANVTGDEIFEIERMKLPTTAPTAGTKVWAGSGSGLNGTYEYALSYVRATGESYIGAVTATVAPSNQGVQLTGIVDPSDATVTAIKVYRKRTVVGGGGAGSTYDYLHVGTISSLVGFPLTFNDDTVRDDVLGSGIYTAGSPAVGFVTKTADNGDTVHAYVTYDYTDQYYWDPVLFNDYDDIIERYGQPYTAAGAIDSELTLAARFAFANGASEVICVPVKTDDATGFTNALAKLLDEDTVSLVGAVTGTTANLDAINAAVYAHIAAARTAGRLRQAFLAQDGTSSIIAADTLRDNARALNNEGAGYINISALFYTNPVTGAVSRIGAQYAAIGVAGMAIARDPQVPLTRKILAGFNATVEQRSESEKNADAAAGLLVLENYGGSVRIRHGVTTAIGNVNTAEFSVVRAKYEIVRRVRDALERGFIGVEMPLNLVAPSVAGSTKGILERLRIEGLMTDFANVKARTLANDPTTVEVKFEYTPIYPINAIEVKFVLNLTAGLTEVTA